jgi:hypothetical protein
MRGPLLAISILLLHVLYTRPLRGQTSLALGAWSSFGWFDGVGPLDDPAGGFSLSLPGSGRLRLTDAFETGDAFDVYVNGVLQLTTPSVVSGIDTRVADGEGAWGDTRLSQGSILLDPGAYQIDVRVREDAGFGFGEAFVRADLVTVSAVPEPGTAMLTGSGLVGLSALATVARRRRGGRAATC